MASIDNIARGLAQQANTSIAQIYSICETSTFTSVGGETIIPIGIANFDSATDKLEVLYEGLELRLTDEYTISGVNILLVDFTAKAGYKFVFNKYTIAKQTVNEEVIASRGTYASLDSRLDASDLSLTNVLNQGYTIDILSYDIYNDGTHASETTAGINQALVAAKQAGYEKVYLLTSGTYLITGNNSNQNYPCTNGIQMLDNIEFVLGSDVELKLETTYYPAYSIIACNNISNVKIKGGKITGDLDTHVFSLTSTFESGALDASGAASVDATRIRSTDFIDSSTYPSFFIFNTLKVFKNNSITPSTYEIDFYTSDDVFISKQTAKVFTTDTISIPATAVKFKLVIAQADYTNCSVDVRDGTFYSHEFGYGIDCRAANDITIEGVEVSKCTGDGIFTGAMTIESIVTNGTNINVLRCNIHHCRRQGISPCGQIGGEIAFNEIHDIGGSTFEIGTAPMYGIDIEPDGNASVENVIIHNNKFYNNYAGDVINFSGNNITVDDNEGTNNFCLGFGSQSKFTRNKIIGDGITTNSSANVKDNIIEGNYISSGSIVLGITTRTKICNNIILNGQIYMSNAIDFLCSNNIIIDEDHTMSYGIGLNGACIGSFNGDKIIGTFSTASMTSDSTAKVVFNNVTFKGYKNVGTARGKLSFKGCNFDYDGVTEGNNGVDLSIGSDSDVEFVGGCTFIPYKYALFCADTSSKLYVNGCRLVAANYIAIAISAIGIFDFMNNIIELTAASNNGINFWGSSGAIRIIDNVFIKTGTSSAGIRTADATVASKVYGNKFIGCTYTKYASDDDQVNIIV